MTKKKTAEDSAADKEKKPPAKKTARARKPTVKKPRAKKPTKEEAASSSPEAGVTSDPSFFGSGAIDELSVETPPDIADVIEAEIIAETPAELAFIPEVDAGDVSEPEVDTAASPLSDEEQELSAIYGDDLNAPATAHAEFSDQKTRDEDRPLTPEINARDERKQRWEDRRRSRREQREAERQARRDRHQQQQSRPPEQRQQHHDRPSQPLQRPLEIHKVNGHDSDGIARVGTPLGDAAAAVFAQLRNGQPLPVRQLAAMMRKRSLVEQDPEQLWPQLKAELLGDERSYRTLGLRPRIVYRGRDLFAPGPVAMSQTADAEAGVATALSKLASATHRAFATRLAKASPQGFERLIHAYLVAAGYRDIEWIKRVGGISYATVLAPGLERTVLISARSGDQPIDRRGVGELRVGVEAKDLVAGTLFSAGELSEDAERELERAGRSISVVCGDQLVAALIHTGVGVVSAAAPLHYVDDQLLDELLAG